MKKILLFSFFLLCLNHTYAQNCNSYGNASIELNVNNVRVGLLNSGDLWWDGQEGKYVAPASDLGFPEVTAIFAGALWFGGNGPSGNLKVAAQQYRQGGQTDFYPGPLEFGTNNITEMNCANWDRFWLVNKSDVESHINDYNNNNIIDNPISSIYSWPGRNNPAFNDNNGFDLPTDHSLAPFFDRDQDGNYDPDQGDYPLIKGDQSIWWVFNDLAGPHRISQATPLSIEVQAMAYAEASANNHINNATYYDFKVTNQGTDPLLNSYMGLWVDFDLGCHEDDFLGYNEEYQMMYAYNQDDVDGSVGSSCSGGINTYGDDIPIIGIKQIGNPENPVTSFVVLDGTTNITNSPEVEFEYYNTLNGTWRDGTPMTFGGNGFDPTSIDSVSFLFTGDPSDANSWNMCYAGLFNADRRAVMSTAMNTIQPGQSFENSYSVIFVEDIDYPCPSLDRLKEAADAVCNNVSTSTVKVKYQNNLTVYPNPASNILHIKSENSIQVLKLLSINGQVLINRTLGSKDDGYDLDISSVNNGLYIISVLDENGNTSLDKVMIQK